MLQRILYSEVTVVITYSTKKIKYYISLALLVENPGTASDTLRVCL